MQRAIARGVSVYQGDIDEGLADYPDGAFDYVILSQTLQETRQPRRVLREMLRVGRRAIVAFPNFGHWKVRASMLFSGRAPNTNLFPYEWYDSPNIHILTTLDFEILAALEHLTIERRYFLSGHRKVTFAAEPVGGSGGVFSAGGLGFTAETQRTRRKRGVEPKRELLAGKLPARPRAESTALEAGAWPRR